MLDGCRRTPQRNQQSDDHPHTQRSAVGAGDLGCLFDDEASQPVGQTGEAVVQLVGHIDWVRRQPVHRDEGSERREQSEEPEEGDAGGRDGNDVLFEAVAQLGDERSQVAHLWMSTNNQPRRRRRQRQVVPAGHTEEGVGTDENHPGERYLMGATHEELVDRAREVAPSIARRAQATEAARQPLDETIAELIDAELFSILVPKRWGGHQASIHTHRVVTEIISEACVSTGWNFAFYSGHNWMAVKYPEQTQEELFADKGYALIPVTTAPALTVEPADGGMSISGRVPWGSGIVHAEWACIGGAAADGTRYQFIVPVEDTRMVDTWHMSAMAGTGSHDFDLDGAFVPEHRILHAVDYRNGDTPGARLHGDPQYLMPILPFIYCETMGIFAGAMRGAYSAFEEIVTQRVRTHSGAALVDSKYSHVKLGEAAAAVDITDRLVADITQEAIDIADAGAFTMQDRVRLKARAGFIVDHCRRAVNDIIHHSGSSNFDLSSPVQRFFRDLNMLATHAFYEWDTCRELLGRDRLGLEPNNPLV